MTTQRKDPFEEISKKYNKKIARAAKQFAESLRKLEQAKKQRML